MPRLRNAFAFQLKKEDMETPKGQSMTVKNDALSIKEILEKWTHGVDPMLTKMPEYTTDPDFDDIDMGEFLQSDVTDRGIIASEASETFTKVKAFQESEKKKKTPTKEEDKEGEK